MSAQWQDSAACLGADPEIFYEAGPNPMDPYPEARIICATCPVIQECLDAALTMEAPAPHVLAHGYRGGKTATARRRLLEKMPARCNDCGGLANKRNVRDRRLCDNCRAKRRGNSKAAYDRAQGAAKQRRRRAQAQETAA